MKFILASVAGAVGVLCASADARAHAMPETSTVSAQSSYGAVLRVPRGCDGEATHTVKVADPESVIAIKPMPRAGRQLATTSGAYARSYDYYGTPTSQGVREIVWSSGHLEDGWHDEFVLRARITYLPTGTTLDFSPTELCQTSEVASDEIAAARQDPHDLDRPAPRLTVIAANEHAGHASDGAAHASMAKAGTLAISEGWARETAATQSNGALYFRLVNEGDAADRLLGGASPAAERVEIHETIMENNVMKMREITPLDVAGGGEIMLEPGGLHVMLIGLAGPLVEGETVGITLEFEEAGEVSLEVPIKSVRHNPAAGGEHKH